MLYYFSPVAHRKHNVFQVLHCAAARLQIAKLLAWASTASLWAVRRAWRFSRHICLNGSPTAFQWIDFSSRRKKLQPGRMCQPLAYCTLISLQAMSDSRNWRIWLSFENISSNGISERHWSSNAGECAPVLDLSGLKQLPCLSSPAWLQIVPAFLFTYCQPAPSGSPTLL